MKAVFINKIFTTIIFVLATFVLSGFISNSKIGHCLKSYYGSSEMRKVDGWQSLDSFYKVLETKNGLDSILVNESYRALFYNKFHAPFVDMYVKITSKETFEADKKIVLGELNYSIHECTGLVSNDPLELDINGFRIYGWNRNYINSQELLLGGYIIFLDNNTIIYFDFYNISPERRNYTNLDSFLKERDTFLNMITNFINECKN